MQQHWLPRGYLKSWCDADCPAHHEPYIWLFDRKGGVGKAKSPKTVFAEPELYTDSEAPERTKHWLEDGLQKLEDKFYWVRDHRIKKRKPLRPQDLAAIYVFISAMFVRSPRYRDHMRKPWEQMVRVAEEMQRHIDAPPPGDPRPRFPPALSGGGPTISVEQARMAAKRPLQLLMGPYVKNMSHILSRMGYYLLHTSTSPGFITSDCPFVMFDPEAWKRPRFYGTGLGARDIEVTFPITPNYLMMLGWRAENRIVDEVPPAHVDQLNRRTCAYSDKQVIAARNAPNPYWFGFEPPADGPTVGGAAPA